LGEEKQQRIEELTLKLQKYESKGSKSMEQIQVQYQQELQSTWRRDEEVLISYKSR